jgi:hypothetical protein
MQRDLRPVVYTVLCKTMLYRQQRYVEVLKMFCSCHRWVPVAPVGTGDSADLFSQLRIPTMFVYGEKDTGLGHRYIV